MKKEKQLKAILFDMDGVLLDSEEYICRAGIMMFKEKGYEVSPDDFLEFTGMGENRYLGGVAEKHGIPFELVKDKARTYEIYEEIVAGQLIPFDGVVDFIELCRSRGLKLAVASSADPPKVETNLEEIGIPASTFGTVVTGLDIEHKKPSPDIFLKAAENLGVDASECLVIEDAISGVAAGKAAGAKVLALTTSFSAEELSGADWVAGLLTDVGDEVLDW
ncbi:MAG: HAD-IA family hydrolase [Bacteroidales bacterium]|nr:HAD-IA family hydrolase [Bacteroidales bacterium]